jgi:CubicO group peptidase (beta-lactamase class C family)
VAGTVAAGFEPVQRLFDAGVRDFGVGGGAIAAYVEGQQVVDLWGGEARPGAPWTEDTLAVLMSTTKGLVGLCAHVLADRELLDVEAPVARYWPEFAQAGKQRVLVRHVLTHTSGVLSFRGQNDLLQWDGTGWDDYDAIAAGLAAATPAWEPGTRFGYHALSFGWLVGELVRRITGRTIGQFFREQIAEPLGLDLWIGTPPSAQARLADVVDRIGPGLPMLARPFHGVVQRLMRNPARFAGQAFLGNGDRCVLDETETLFRSPAGLAAEIPAANGTGTARSLARVFAMLSMGGRLDGVRVVSEESVVRHAAPAFRGPDALMAQIRMPFVRQMLTRQVSRSLGYLINPILPGQPPGFGPTRSAFGHDGAGGQTAFCDLEHRVAVGSVRSELTALPRFSARLVREVYACAGLPTGGRKR